jgi:hypothetical protein
MEKPWYPQQTEMDAPVALLKNFVHYINLRISKLTIENDVRSHPQYPQFSFDTLSGILQKWGLKAISYYWDLERLHQIPSPSVLFIHEEVAGVRIGNFVMFHSINNGMIEYLHPRKGWVLESADDFGKKWAQVAFSLAESEFPKGEIDFEEKERIFTERRKAHPDLRILDIKDDFLTGEECDYIVQLSVSKLKKSRVMTESHIEMNERSSYTADLMFPADILLNGIRKRASELTGMPESHVEVFQCVSYEAGQEYHNHYDTFDENTEFGKKTILEGGQRKYTLLVYLNDDFRGGNTYFPELDTLVSPKKGRAVIFDNLNKDLTVNRSALHAGLPVTGGRKFALNIWIRNKPAGDQLDMKDSG